MSAQLQDSRTRGNSSTAELQNSRSAPHGQQRYTCFAWARWLNSISALPTHGHVWPEWTYAYACHARLLRAEFRALLGRGQHRIQPSPCWRKNGTDDRSVFQQATARGVPGAGRLGPCAQASELRISCSSLRGSKGRVQERLESAKLVSKRWDPRPTWRHRLVSLAIGWCDVCTKVHACHVCRKTEA